MSNFLVDAVKNIGNGLFLSTEQKAELLRRWPAMMRRHQAAWLIHNNYTEGLLSAQATPQVHELMRQSYTLGLEADRLADQVEAGIRAAVEKAINQKKITADDARSAGLSGLPLALLVVAALLSVGVVAALRLTEPAIARREAILMQVAQQVKAANEGRPIPSFPEVPGAGDSIGAQISKAGSGVALALAAVAGLFLLSRRRP